MNPGGGLDPSQVWDRDDTIAEIWRSLARPQSVYLTGERRAGKTAIVTKMKANPPPDLTVVYTDVEAINTLGEFAEKLLVSVSEALPAVAKSRGWLARKLKSLGITKVGLAGFGVEFAEVGERQWDAIVRQVVESLERLEDRRVVLVLDELPQLLTNIASRGRELDARQVLDTLREIRQTHRKVTMIFTGSIGLHHVVKKLAASGSWAPINDMAVVDVPPLDAANGRGLARELVVNEGIATESVDVLTTAIASSAGNAPFYIHQIVSALSGRPRTAETASAATIEQIVIDKINNAQDPWQLGHFITRVPSYYGPDADYVMAVLDIVANGEPLPFEELRLLVPAKLEITDQDLRRLSDLIDLLQKDYYLVKSPDHVLRFRQSLLARFWRARRSL